MIIFPGVLNQCNWESELCEHTLSEGKGAGDHVSVTSKRVASCPMTALLFLACAMPCHQQGCKINCSQDKKRVWGSITVGSVWQQAHTNEASHGIPLWATMGLWYHTEEKPPFQGLDHKTESHIRGWSKDGFKIIQSSFSLSHARPQIF